MRKPSYDSEALHRIREVNAGGMVVGISMLDPILAEVKAKNLQGMKVIGVELLENSI